MLPSSSLYWFLSSRFQVPVDEHTEQNVYDDAMDNETSAR